MRDSSSDHDPGPRLGFRGALAAILVAADAATPMKPVEAVEAIPGVGLSGDRYANGTGTYWAAGRAHGQVTLIEAEAVEGAARESGLAVEAAETRRNLVTRGVPLNHLVDREFRVGDVTLRGVKLCEPCTHIEELSGKPIRKPLVHRGGLNAVIVTGGTLRLGDAIMTVEDAT